MYLYSDHNEINDKISKLYPAAFEALTYQNYKAKFHTLLFIDELEVNIEYFYVFNFIQTNFFFIYIIYDLEFSYL